MYEAENVSTSEYSYRYCRCGLPAFFKTDRPAGAGLFLSWRPCTEVRVWLITSAFLIVDDGEPRNSPGFGGENEHTGSRPDKLALRPIQGHSYREDGSIHVR